MRIGIDIRHLTDPQPAGVGGYTKQLLAALFRLDQKNDYVLLATGMPSTLRRLPSFDAPNVTVMTVPVPNKLVTGAIALSRHPNLEALIPKEKKPDAWFFPNHNFIATRLPYAIMVHDLSYEIFPEFFTLKSRLRHGLARSTIKNATTILCPSWSTKQDLMGIYGIDETKIVVTPLATEQPPLNPLLLPPPPNPSSGRRGDTAPGPHPEWLPKRYLLSLATLEPRKNQLSMIEAYEAYRDQTHDDVALVIAGGKGWKSAATLRAAKKSRYAKDIHLLGYVDEGQKAELYRRAQVFVFPSFYEGFGLPVLEAMAAGCPVIASHTSSLPELVGDAGLLIDPYNVNDVTMAIKLVLTSDRLRTDLIHKGLRRAENFSWEATDKQTLEVLQSLK